MENGRRSIGQEGEHSPYARPRRALLAAGTFGALTLATASRVYLSITNKGFADEPFRPILAAEALRWGLWLPAVPLILAAERRWGFSRGSVARATAMHGALAVTVILVHTAIMTMFGQSANWYFTLPSFGATMRGQLLHEGMTSLLVYAVIVGSVVMRRQWRDQEARRIAHSSLEARLARERLRNLQMQLHPHFLFNTLHAVAGLLREGDRHAAVATISDLGDLLRRSLEQSERQLVTLDEEVTFVTAYLKILQARLGPQLAISIVVDDQARALMVPNLILQPLVENAVRHGASQVDAGRIEIRARVQQDRLLLEIADNGPGLADSGAGRGIGLANTRARLTELYGDDFAFALDHGRHGTVARLDIPATTSSALASS